jgi:hypothetical protein
MHKDGAVHVDPLLLIPTEECDDGDDMTVLRYGYCDDMAYLLDFHDDVINSHNRASNHCRSIAVSKEYEGIWKEADVP